MVVLRADPWSPEYGMGFHVHEEDPEGPPERTHPFVESDGWDRPIRPSPAVGAEPVWFIDGVRRVEAGVIAEQEGRRAPGLFGAFAVGAVRCDGEASFAENAIRRVLVLAGGLESDAVEIPLPGATLAFEPFTDRESGPERPLWKLQDLMRDGEAALAARLAGTAEGLILMDGPLTLKGATRAPVVGMVKRLARRYLDTPQEALLGRLGPAERTPLFGIGLPRGAVDRFAWYTRLVPMRPYWHDRAGVVRCEVRAGVGLEAARALADRVTAALPPYAGRPSDPRAPQNLAPVGALESWLRHRMGHPGIVRRAITQWLASQASRSA